MNDRDLPPGLNVRDLPPGLLLAVLVFELIRSKKWIEVTQHLPLALVEQIDTFLSEHTRSVTIDVSDSSGQTVH